MSDTSPCKEVQELLNANRALKVAGEELAIERRRQDQTGEVFDDGSTGMGEAAVQSGR
jgi:hypothetical protein